MSANAVEFKKPVEVEERIVTEVTFTCDRCRKLIVTETYNKQVTPQDYQFRNSRCPQRVTNSYGYIDLHPECLTEVIKGCLHDWNPVETDGNWDSDYTSTSLSTFCKNCGLSRSLTIDEIADTLSTNQIVALINCIDIMNNTMHSEYTGLKCADIKTNLTCQFVVSEDEDEDDDE